MSQCSSQKRKTEARCLASRWKTLKIQWRRVSKKFEFSSTGKTQYFKETYSLENQIKTPLKLRKFQRTILRNLQIFSFLLPFSLPSVLKCWRVWVSNTVLADKADDHTSSSCQPSLWWKKPSMHCRRQARTGGVVHCEERHPTWITTAGFSARNSYFTDSLFSTERTHWWKCLTASTKSLRVQTLTGIQ